MKTKHWLWIGLLLVGLIIVGVALIKYLIWIGKFTQDQFWDWMKVWGVVVAVLIGVILLIIFIIEKILSKDDKNKSMIEYVDGEDAIKILTEKFIVNTDMKYKVDYSEKEGKVMLINRRALLLRNIYSWSDKLTGMPWTMFELHATEGNKAGINMFVLPLYRGKEWLGNNWRHILREHTPFDIYKPEFKQDQRQLPVDTPQSEMTRTNMHVAELIKEGDMTSEELKAYQDLMKQKPITQQPAPTKEQPLVPDEVIEAQAQAQQVQDMIKLNKVNKER